MNFNDILNALPGKVLKRPLSDSERSEILEICSVFDMKTVQEYLYLILTFKMFEDKLEGKISALAIEFEDKITDLNTVEENIDSTLQSIRDTLKGEAAKALNEAAAGMVSKLSEGMASEALKAAGIMKEYQQLRGQMIIVIMMTLSMAVGCVFGSFNGIAPIVSNDSSLYALLALPMGWMMIFCSSAYGLLWSYDNWKSIRKTYRGKCILAAQVLVLLWLLLLMF